MSDAAPPRLVYIIRHAEKPDGSDGAVGVDVEGNPDPHSLVPRGWQRSGALGVLYTAGVDGLVTPDHLICPDYGATTPVHRTYQTLLGVNIHVLVAYVLDRRRFGMSAGGLPGVLGATLRWVRAVVAARVSR